MTSTFGEPRPKKRPPKKLAGKPSTGIALKLNPTLILGVTSGTRLGARIIELEYVRKIESWEELLQSLCLVEANGHIS